jgi:hypothetical protein
MIKINKMSQHRNASLADSAPVGFYFMANENEIKTFSLNPSRQT